MHQNLQLAGCWQQQCGTSLYSRYAVTAAYYMHHSCFPKQQLQLTTQKLPAAQQQGPISSAVAECWMGSHCRQLLTMQLAGPFSTAQAVARCCFELLDYGHCMAAMPHCSTVFCVARYIAGYGNTGFECGSNLVAITKTFAGAVPAGTALQNTALLLAALGGGMRIAL